MSNKRVWIFLRGLVREQRHWGHFPDIFHSFFPGDELILYDFPGNGQRFQENSATSITAMLNDVRSFTQTQTKQPVNILALSLGGMVATEWMNQYPGECESAILISTSLRGLNPFYQRLLPSSYPAVFGSLLFSRDTQKNETASLQLVSNIVASDALKSENTIKHWVSIAEQCPVSGINGLRQLLAAIRFNVPEHCPQVPMLVLASQADRLVSHECSKSLAQHWQLPIEMHETAGHDIPLDDNQWVCEKIQHWLNEAG